MNTLAETEEAYAIEQALRAEWGRCLSFGFIGRTEPLASKVWDEYFQPELERKLKALRKPYDQEADVGDAYDYQHETPQQVNYLSTLVQRQLEDRVKLMQQCNERQFEMIGNLRRELASKQTEVEGQLVVELTDLRAEVNMLRNTWSPPPTYPPGPFHAVADLELIRTLQAEVWQLKEERDTLGRRVDGLVERIEAVREGLGSEWDCVFIEDAVAQLQKDHIASVKVADDRTAEVYELRALLEERDAQVIESELLYKSLYDGQNVARIQEDLKQAYAALRDRDKDLERYEDRLERQAAIISDVQKIALEIRAIATGAL